MKPVCYLDMDGVLVDFSRGAFDLHHKVYNPGSVTWDFWKDMGLTEEEFWSPMDFSFWANLPWTSEGRLLFGFLDGIFHENMVLLTSPSLNHGAIEGKIAWVTRHIPHMRRRVMVGACKSLLAGPTKILVDDNATNVVDFSKAGGKTVLVPRPWNQDRVLCLHNGEFSVYDVVDDVKDIVFCMNELESK